METNTNATNNISIAKKLFDSAMKGEWNNIVEMYWQDSAAHKAKISRSGDTVLHVAVSDIQEDVVEELVSIINQKNLEVKNERGDTALHIAASLGSVRICSCLAEADNSLLGLRNRDNETPLFVAALHGKKGAFLCLNYYLKSNPEHGDSYTRRKDGQTILHCAISGDYFDLAFQIIQLYEKLVYSVDEHGLSPLHILASKPAAFRSGCHLGRGSGIIYHCVFVDDLKFDSSFHQPANISKEMQSLNYPGNYATCIHFLKVLKRLVQLVFGSSNCTEVDTENPQGHQLLPPNYSTCFDFVKLGSKAMLIVLGLGSQRIKKLEEKKKKHTWSVQIMNELLKRASNYEYEDNGSNPQAQSDEDHSSIPQPLSDDKETKEDNDHNQEQNVQMGSGSKLEGKNAKTEDIKLMKVETDIWIAAKGSGITGIVEKILEVCPTAIHDVNSKRKNIVLLAVESRQPHVYQQNIMKETPILIAAKYGITEMVEKILEACPVAIHDMNSEKKNAVLLAVENRQPHVYQLLHQRSNIMKDSIFRAVDANGNSALHLAALLSDHKPWLIPGAALQMQWEIKWYEFVKNSMPFNFFAAYNKQGKTPRDVFSDTHHDLVREGGTWLTNTSQSYSLVAALIATVAFATSTTVPGGTTDKTGKPNLESQPAFDVFAFSSLIALCFSVTALIMFLAILTSRYQERDFGSHLPKKLLFGLTSLFVSIASMLVSFCAGHFLILSDKLKYAAFPAYAVTCLPVTLFAVAQFPLYFDLARATIQKVPQRSYSAISL